MRPFVTSSQEPTCAIDEVCPTGRKGLLCSECMFDNMTDVGGECVVCTRWNAPLLSLAAVACVIFVVLLYRQKAGSSSALWGQVRRVAPPPPTHETRDRNQAHATHTTLPVTVFTITPQ